MYVGVLNGKDVDYYVFFIVLIKIDGLIEFMMVLFLLCFLGNGFVWFGEIVDVDFIVIVFFLFDDGEICLCDVFDRFVVWE